MLREHIETMAELGVVFHHVFVKEKLGFQILIARYGAEGTVVVRDAASAAAFETSTANKAFRTTSALNRK